MADEDEWLALKLTVGAVLLLYASILVIIIFLKVVSSMSFYGSSGRAAHDHYRDYVLSGFF